MVVIWGNILSFIGNVVALAVEVLVFDAFFPRNESRKKRWLCILLWCVIATFLSVSVGTKFGYTLKMLQEVALIYLFCVFLYQSRWDRRLFIVVTVYSVLFSYSHWFDELCMRISGFTYEEYIWNVPLYSIFFFLRCSFILAFAFLINKYHKPLHARTQPRAWVPLSAAFPVCTLLVLRQVYTYSEEQRVWQICLLILNLVDIAALILLDYLEENAENREKLIAANERAHVQDENIQALSQAYVGQRKMTHDFRANLSTLSELLESERIDDAKEFLSELNVRQSERILLVNSHNAAIDAVLNQKGYIGKKQGIDMRFRVNDLSALRLPRVDVTIVLGNLIDNAIKYSHDSLNIYIYTKQEGNRFIIGVRDTGIGIPKEAQDKVFKRFYRVPSGNLHNVKGFGLGLSYAKSIVELHGGEIQLTSKKNKGTLVEIIFKMES